MKNLLLAFAITVAFALFGYAFLDGLDREAQRQCEVAKDTCEKYADAGACDPKYMKICEGAENE